MLTYLEGAIDHFLEKLPPGTKDILEIGSDIPCEAASTLAEKTGARVIGLNPAPWFPRLPETVTRGNGLFLIRGDGRFLPFPDRTFDAVMSIATMEHVYGLESFLAEVARVLKPNGVFYANSAPIWSSAIGHHVYAKAGSRLASFWRPGKNPIPDHAHLLMTPEEMRIFLRSGPCCDELIEPIIQWIYLGDDVNRCFYEEYVDAFRKSSMELLSIESKSLRSPDEETLAKLHLKYGESRNFDCSSITAVFRKPPQDTTDRQPMDNKRHGKFLFEKAGAFLKRVLTWAKLNPGKFRMLVVFEIIYTLALLGIFYLIYRYVA